MARRGSSPSRGAPSTSATRQPAAQVAQSTSAGGSMANVASTAIGHANTGASPGGSSNEQDTVVDQSLSDSSDEDEDEEEEDEPMDDLINDEEEEEAESSSDDDGPRGKRSHDDDESSRSSVDSEDYALIREAGISVPKKKKKQFKRIRALVDSDEEGDADDGRTAIEREIFPDAGVLDSDVDDEPAAPRADMDLNLDESEEDDSDSNFIVDDEDQPIKSQRKRQTNTAMDKALEIFGVDFDYEDVEASDEGEEGEERTGLKSIYDLYEPSEIQRHLMTEFDQKVKIEDQPERHQLRPIRVIESEGEDIKSEAAWIFKQKFAGSKSELIIPEIEFALDYIRNEKLEAIFTAAYRREYILSIASNFDDTDALWSIYDQDALWCNFRKRKDTLFELFKAADPRCVEEAATFEELDDCRALYLTQGPKKTRKRYERFSQERLDDIVKEFGLTPEHFGENLREDYQRNSVVQCQRKPLDVAGDKDHLTAAIFSYAKLLSSDPTVRRVIRKNYFDNAVINVKPTELGMKEIDENHPCYPSKALRNKPVKVLSGDQFLHITNAEKDKLITVNFNIEPTDPTQNNLSPYHESLKALYYSDFSSIVTKEWNDRREEAIKICTSKFLFPSFEKQLRERLARDAQEKIISTCCERLRSWLNVAPYAPGLAFDDYEDFELRNGTRICGFTFAPEGDQPCFAAIVDSEGELIAHVELPHLNIRRKMDAIDKEKHAKNRQAFKQFIIDKKPHVVALAAETIQTKYICQDLAQILDELREHDGLPLIPIEIVDNNVSNVYMNLKKANEEFPGFKPLLLQAISNARRLNDPLSEFAKLCNVDNDILCLRFHTLQDDLPRERLLAALHHEFVTRVNAVGVDPNRAIAHPHTADVVQFVAGLGPRKSAHLLRSIKKLSTGGKLVSRNQLVTELGMTSKIFMNSAGFIKLDTDTLADEFPDEHITPLDSTRIHPESYGLAKKIACDALDYDEDASDETTANAIEEILDNPEKLDDLDLNAFALELERQSQGKKGFILQSIREEFQVRYREHREAYKAPSQEEIFAMLTKETPSSFYIGKLVTCQVANIVRRKPNSSRLDMAQPEKIEETNLWRCPFCKKSDFADLSVVWSHFDQNDCPGEAIGVKCRLDNGLSGFVPIKFLSDSQISDPSQRVAPRQTIHARVMKIDTDKFSCELTCRSSDLNDEAGRWKLAKDEYYDYAGMEAIKRELELKSKRATRKPYCKRVIVHPAFENIDYKACETKLESMEQGHAIIRPSSAGQNFLTVSWKICDGINQHIIIREEGKANAFSLGHQLFIENEPYEDLDEILARYIQPMASYARELLNYKYCVQLKQEVEEVQQMQDVLLIEKTKSSCFPYRFLPSRSRPGKFLLGYLPSNKPKIEYLTLTPRGYRFRQMLFKNLAMLIKWFKENWNQRLPPPLYPGITPGIGDSVRQTFPMSQ